MAQLSVDRQSIVTDATQTSTVTGTLLLPDGSEEDIPVLILSPWRRNLIRSAIPSLLTTINAMTQPLSDTDLCSLTLLLHGLLSVAEPPATPTVVQPPPLVVTLS